MSKTQLETELEVFAALKKPFELTAFSIDSSRGFDLASLKAQYIPDRLNEVLGLTNWNFTGFFEPIMSGDKESGVLYHGVLTIRIGEMTKQVPSVGYSGVKKNVGDSRKGAMTDALSKAASHIGVADAAFKGLVSCDEIRKVNKSTKQSDPAKTEKTGKQGKAPSFSKKQNNDLDI